MVKRFYLIGVGAGEDGNCESLIYSMVELLSNHFFSTGPLPVAFEVVVMAAAFANPLPRDFGNVAVC